MLASILIYYKNISIIYAFFFYVKLTDINYFLLLYLYQLKFVKIIFLITDIAELLLWSITLLLWSITLLL